LMQVCFGFSEQSTRKREISALLKANEKYPVKNMIIVTFNNEESILEDNLTIEVVPAWKWILRGFN